MDAPGYNPFPTGSRVEVWWPGDRRWYVAQVTGTRIELHKIKGAMGVAGEAGGEPSGG